MTNDQAYKIETYLSGEMPPEERQAFEAELAADAELRRELRLYQLADKAIERQGQARLREMMRETRAKLGPLPEPELTWWDRVRFFFYSRAYLGATLGLLALLLLAGVWLVATPRLCPAAKITSDYFIEASLFAQAGPEEAIARATILAQCREYYANEQPEKLEQLAMQEESRGVASYFLAHWHLKRANFEEAGEAFLIALANREQLKRHSDLQDMGKLKFNLLLCEMGKNRDWQATLDGLAVLRDDPDVQGTAVKEKIAQLEKDLQQPLARALCPN
jgi:hypothetical protein